MSKEKRVLPADVYDALELAALASGGLSCGSSYGPECDWVGNEEEREREDCPGRALGHAAFAENRPRLRDWRDSKGPMTAPVEEAFGWDGEDSDRAVRSIIRRRNLPHDSRVPFAAWCKELNVVRGDS